MSNVQNFFFLVMPPTALPHETNGKTVLEYDTMKLTLFYLFCLDSELTLEAVITICEIIHSGLLLLSIRKSISHSLFANNVLAHLGKYQDSCWELRQMSVGFVFVSKMHFTVFL